MWKKWNRTGRIKAIALLVLMIPNIIVPAGYDTELDIFGILFPFFFGALTIPLIGRFNQALPGREIVKPDWNDNPFSRKRPLSSFHFGAFFFIVVGISVLLGALIRFHALNHFGLMSISFGVGILAGIRLAVQWLEKR